MSNTNNHLNEISLVPGMTLRDYFAAKAANGYISSLDDGRLNYVPPSTIAGYAYEVADAMLAAREVKS